VNCRKCNKDMSLVEDKRLGEGWGAKRRFYCSDKCMYAWHSNQRYYQDKDKILAKKKVVDRSNAERLKVARRFSLALKSHLFCDGCTQMAKEFVSGGKI
jgi:hypothetical protein